MSEVETIEFKFRKPNDVYMRWIEKPNKGQEALFRKGHNEDRVKAHKGGLLNVININSEPEGKLVMDGQHHRIIDAGIGPTSALVFRGMTRGIDRGEVTFKDHGRVQDNGRELIKIEAIYPETCDGITHTVAKDETLWDIADQYKQDMYVILSVNKHVKSPTHIKEGQQILVPYHYCGRTIAYIDSSLNLLVKLEIFDWDNNLYEFYEFKDIQLNVGLTDTDFDPKNPAYKF
jgi:outer membrane lipoprotein-sorting protein